MKMFDDPIKVFLSFLPPLVVVPCVFFCCVNSCRVVQRAGCALGPSFPHPSLRQVVLELEVYPCGDWIM